MNFDYFKILILFQNFAILQGEVLEKQIQMSTTTETTISFSLWPETTVTLPTAFTTTSFSSEATTGYESPWVLFNLPERSTAAENELVTVQTSLFTDDKENQISADETQIDFDSRIQMSNFTIGENHEKTLIITNGVSPNFDRNFILSVLILIIWHS